MKGEGPPGTPPGLRESRAHAAGHAGLLARRSDGCLLRKPRGLAWRHGAGEGGASEAGPGVRTRGEACRVQGAGRRSRSLCHEELINNPHCRWLQQFGQRRRLQLGEQTWPWRLHPAAGAGSSAHQSVRLPRSGPARLRGRPDAPSASRTPARRLPCSPGGFPQPPTGLVEDGFIKNTSLHRRVILISRAAFKLPLGIWSK